MKSSSPSVELDVDVAFAVIVDVSFTFIWGKNTVVEGPFVFVCCCCCCQKRMRPPADRHQGLQPTLWGQRATILHVEQ